MGLSSQGLWAQPSGMPEMLEAGLESVGTGGS